LELLYFKKPPAAHGKGHQASALFPKKCLQFKEEHFITVSLTPKTKEIRILPKERNQKRKKERLSYLNRRRLHERFYHLGSKSGLSSVEVYSD
jgi:hypothetical protein